MSYGPPVITIDVEDWPQSTWDRSLPITERAVNNTRRVLRLLREIEVRATHVRARQARRTFSSSHQGDPG